MIEVYAFLAAFTMQILVVSVLHPAWFARYARAKVEAQLPGRDDKVVARFLSLYRAANTIIAVLGLVLMGWLFTHMRSADWDLSPVRQLLSGYIVLQLSPFVLASLIGAWEKKKALKRSPPQIKRTARLQRRGLFDIVSPLTVVFAVVVYFLFAAFVVYVQKHSALGFSGYRILGRVTLAYALNAFLVYWLLYRRKRWPLETSAYRMQAVGVQIKITFYVSIAAVVFLLLNVSLELLELQRWVPFAMSVYFAIVMLLTSMMLFTLQRQAEADRLGASPAS